MRHFWYIFKHFILWFRLSIIFADCFNTHFLSIFADFFRILGTTTLGVISYMFYKSRGLKLPLGAQRAALAVMCMGWMQVGLGITTLLLYVPVPIAALHQSGALVTLSTALWLSHELKLMKVLRALPK